MITWIMFLGQQPQIIWPILCSLHLFQPSEHSMNYTTSSAFISLLNAVRATQPEVWLLTSPGSSMLTGRTPLPGGFLFITKATLLQTLSMSANSCLYHLLPPQHKKKTKKLPISQRKHKPKCMKAVLALKPVLSPVLVIMNRCFSLYLSPDLLLYLRSHPFGPSQPTARWLSLPTHNTKCFCKWASCF